MPEFFLLKGIMIGLLFGIPIGGVGVMTVQRTLEYGPRMGILTGVGSSAADCLYACVGAFGLTYISDFLLHHQKIIHILGGSFLLFTGIRLLLKKNDSNLLIAPVSAPRTQGIGSEVRISLVSTLSSFLAGITNPVAILTFLFAFSLFDIPGQMGFVNGSCLVLGVFIGTLWWWIILVFLAGKLKSRFAQTRFCSVNRIFGAILCLLGLAVFIG